MSELQPVTSGEVVTQTGPLLISPFAEGGFDQDAVEYMSRIRQQWQSKGLIERVRRLIRVDPSSACQRLLNAAIADLKEKIVIAGIDIAKESAKAYKLPPLEKSEDIDNYSTHNTINLSYRMGLLTRPEWKRLSRSYEIRRDLEHEDIEYEATPEDFLYIFKTCIEYVLSRDPVTLIKVSEVKDIIQSQSAVTPDPALIEDYKSAPPTRQTEIGKLLFSIAAEKDESDIVRENAFNMARSLTQGSKQETLVDLGKHVQEKIGRGPLNETRVRTADALGVLPYLRNRQRKEFFGAILNKMNDISYHWTSHQYHGDLLSKLEELESLTAVPEAELKGITKWMVLLYLGEPGGVGQGKNRQVFYSNTGAPKVENIFRKNKSIISPVLRPLESDPDVKNALEKSRHIANRFQELLDTVE